MSGKKILGKFISQKRKTIFSILLLILILNTFPIKTNAYSIRNHTFCKDVDTSVMPLKPIQPTETFYATDEQIVLLIILENVVVSHTAISRWFDPNGNLFDTIQVDVSDPKTEGVDVWETFSVYFYLLVEGYDAEKLPGQWKVEVYIDGNFKFSDQFELKLESPSSDLKVEVYPSKEVFQIGEEVFISLYVSRAIDESDLKISGPYTETDEVGSFPSETYISYTLGTAEKGDVGNWEVTFTGCYYSQGQKFCDSFTSSFKVVTKIQEIPPDIEIIAQADSTSKSIGETLSLKVNLENHGNMKAVNINTEVSSDGFELTGGSKSWILDSLAPGESSQSKIFSFQTIGPIGDGKITVTTSYFDEKGEEYLRTEAITIKITQAIIFQLTNFYDVDKLADYFTRFIDSPYPVYNNIEVTIPNGERIENVFLEVSGIEIERIQLEDIGGGKYRADIIPFERLTSEETRDITWQMMRNIAESNNFDLPEPNWNWRDVRGGWDAIQLDSICVSFEDGTEVRRRVDSTLPTLMDVLQSNTQNWGEGTFVVALSEGRPPADLFVVNPNGLSIGTNIDESGNPTLVNVIPGAFYSGRDTNPQFIFMPPSSGEILIKTFGNRDDIMDLLIFNSMDSRGSAEIRRSLQIRKGSISEYTSNISEEGVIESLEPKAAFPWSQLDNIWPILIAIPIIIGVIAIFIIKRRRVQPTYTRPPEDTPPQTIPEEIPGGR